MARRTAEDEGVKAAIEVFQQENPGIAVEWRHTRDAGKFGRVLLTDLASGTAPEIMFCTQIDREIESENVVSVSEGTFSRPEGFEPTTIGSEDRYSIR